MRGYLPARSIEFATMWRAVEKSEVPRHSLPMILSCLNSWSEYRIAVRMRHREYIDARKSPCAKPKKHTCSLSYLQSSRQKQVLCSPHDLIRCASLLSLSRLCGNRPSEKSRTAACYNQCRRQPLSCLSLVLQKAYNPSFGGKWIWCLNLW